MRKHKNKIIAGVIIAIALAFVFWYGGDAPGLRGWTPEPQEDVTVVQNNENAEEILQDTYIKFLEKLSKLKIKDNPLGYLFKISRNLSLDFIRKNKHERHIEFEESNYEHSVQEETKHHNILEEAKQLLDEQEYEIVIMHAVNGHTHKEISQIIRKPIGTITWAYNNAIKKLRKGLAYYG